MTDKQFTELIKYLDTKFEILADQIKTVQKTSDITYGDLEQDRITLGKISVILETAQAQFKEVGDLLRRQTAKITASVGERLDDTVGALAGEVIKSTKEAVDGVLDDFTSEKPKIVKKDNLLTRVKRFITKKR